MEFEKNTLLFGADSTPRIVAIELGETATVNVYRREIDGSTVADVEPFHPFVWADSDVVDLGIESEKLQGDLNYGWLITVDSWKELIVVDPNNIEEFECAALKRLTSLIKERDPDVIEGHNLFRFDLPYLVDRAKKLKTKLDWGRSGGLLRSRPSRLQIAEKTIDYPKFTIGGRHFVDTFLLAQFYDVGMRSLAGFERADVARHFDLCDSEDISTLTGKELQRAYLDDSESFRRRALCGVRETRALSDLLSPSYFIQAQIFPYNYQDVIVRGNATRINALFLREYFRRRHSIPELPMVRAVEGGYTDIFL